MSRRTGQPWLLVLCASALLTACPSNRSGISPGQDGPPRHVPVDPHSVPDAVPRYEPRSRYGNPESYEIAGKRYYPLNSSRDFREVGIASWYGRKFHGRRTSSGEPFDMFAMTAAHPTLPLPTYVQVRHLGNGRQIVVKVNDRGPVHGGRILDLSWAAAVKLGMEQAGSAEVEVVAIHVPPDAPPGRQPVAGALPPLAQDPPPPSQAVQSAPVGVGPVVQAASIPPSYLQFGAYGEIANADAKASQVRAAGVPGVQIQQAQTTLGTLFRVVTGPFLSAADLAAARSAMVAQGFDTTVVRPPQP